MSSKELLLSICIPAYNQPDKVEKFLKDTISRLNLEIGSQIEIVVRDDSVNLETKKIIEEYSEKISVPIRYFQGKKEGLDVAIIFLTQESMGNYVWWLGDDVLENGAIEKIINLIQKNPNISLIYINSKNINDDNDIAFKKEEDYLFKDKNQVLEEINDQLGFITATIFRKSDAVQALTIAGKYIGTAWVNLFIILSVMARGDKFYFVQNPFILSAPKPLGEARWYDSFQVHGINYFLILNEFKNKFNKQVIRKSLADKFGRAWRAVIVERAMGFTTGFGSKTPKIKQMFKCYWNYPEFWIALPLFLTPRFILTIFYKIYNFFLKKPYRLLFRKFFSHKTKVDFPAGYIPNRFFLSRIDRGPALVIGDYMGRDYPAIKEKIEETYLLDIVDNGVADNDFFIRQSITEPIKFSDNYFQRVIIAEVIEHVWDDKSVLRELYRILSPKGKLLMSVPLFHDFTDHHYHIYSSKTILNLLKHSGFSVVEAQYKGLSVAIPNELVALMALLLFPVFGEKALLKVNNFFYRLHLLFSGCKKLNSIFRFKHPFLRGYGVLIEAVKNDKIVDSIQMQKDSFQL